jgi:hypothetical protein
VAEASFSFSASVTMRPFLSRAFVKKSHIVTFARLTVWVFQSVAKGEYTHCHDIGLRLAAHRAGGAVASSVVMLGWQSFLCANPASPLSPVRRLVWQSCGKGVPPLPNPRQSLPVLRKMAA